MLCNPCFNSSEVIKFRLIIRVTSVGVLYGFDEGSMSIQTHAVCVSVQEAPGMTKVQQWQETCYGTDSGIQSGATTVRSDKTTTEYSTQKFSTTFAENPAGTQTRAA